MRKLILKTLCLVMAMEFAAVTVACSDDGDGKSTSVPREDISVSRSEEQLVEANNEFAYKWLGVMNEAETENDNFVISPLSLSMALSMTANGAAGVSQSEILNVLGFDADDLDAANALNCKLMQKLPTLDNVVKLRLANSMWIPEYMSQLLKSSFASTLMDNYQAPVTAVEDMSSQQTLNLINGWCAEKTDNVIPAIFKDPLPSSTLMVLANALYFKGEWTEKFEKSKTIRAAFSNADGSISQVDYMRKSEAELRAFSDDKYSVAAFPFGNEAYSMIVVLPEEGVSLDECVKELDGDDITKLAQDKMSGKFSMNVRIPKFTVEYEKELKAILESMGIRSIFGNADFSGMWDGLVSMGISMVKQCAKIEVDEEGAEAAAVTVVKGDTTSPGPMVGKDFIVDRPFVFIIAEHSTGLPLFMGRVTKL